MPLLIAAYSRVARGAPFVLAGNRDELFPGPRFPWPLLSVAPRILGGRDLVASGTWMAVGVQGVMAALTNRPPASPSPPPGLRSRGELPLRLVRHATARAAVRAFVEEVDPRDYNPCWILVGDRESLFYLEVWSGAGLAARELPPGLHILENRPLDAPSPKVDYVRARLPALPQLGRGWLRKIASTLASREIPLAARAPRSPDEWRPAEVEAACVHAGAYGTRWSGIAAVGVSKAAPRFCFSDGPPCEAPYRRADWGLAEAA